MQPSENPYASPQTAPEAADPSRIESLKWLRGAALGIMILAGLQWFGAATWFCALPFYIVFEWLDPTQASVPAWLLVLGWFASIAILIRAGFMFYGATHLRAANNYRWARLSTILALIGIFVPYFWCEVPFGLWAFLLLRKEKYQALFESRARATPPTSPPPH